MIAIHLVKRRRAGRRGACALMVAVSLAGLCIADARPANAQPVVQALPDPAAAELSEALRRLARDPQSLPALVTAGRASLQLADYEAARGFFLRAEAIAPADGRVLVGLALVELKELKPVAAIRQFDLAEQAGEPLGVYAADRGLAHDLVGDNSRAQELYRESLARENEPEVQRRLALSYAISGDQEASEATLLPLLQASDLAAFRTRAFVLAIGGKADEAETIATTMLPQGLARRLAPYLRYMPSLTRAQQAAAANLGQFPSSGQSGREDTAIASYGAVPAAPANGGRADARLIPGGEPLGPSAAQAAADPVEPAPVAEPVRQADAAPRVSLNEAFADLVLPAETVDAPLAAGAVDITRINPVREERQSSPPALPEPRRHWVQVATGRDVSAFRFDWRRIAGEANGLLADHAAFYSDWGNTNRLLTGPFDSEDDAQAFVTSLAGEGVESFRYTSPSGERIRPIP